MKHICVIGNSQVGALKQGYDSLNDPTFRASFFAIPGGGGPYLDIKDNAVSIPEESSPRVITDIVPMPSDRFDISKYDAILLSGVGGPAIRNTNNCVGSKYLVAGFIENRNYVDRQVLSKDVFSISIEKELHRSSSFLNINKISSIFNKKIYVQNFPLPTPIVLSQSDFDMQCYGKNVGEFLSWYYKKKINAMEAGVNRENVMILNYPQEWLEDGFTPIKYSSQDAWHMNKEFGSYFMGQLLEMVL